MADASGPIIPEAAIAPPEKTIERRVSEAEDTIAYVVTPTESEPDAPKDPNAKRDPKADPRLGDKLWRFVQPWDWKLAKVEDKPLKFPTITDVVSLDAEGWKIVRNGAGIIGIVASMANLLLVTVFACTIASMSTFGLLQDAPWWITGPVWFLLMVLATVIAGVLQLATDFGLPWASGLAFEKYKISPTAIIVMWAFFFMPTTLIMKFDLYSSWAHERQAEIVQKQTENVNDARILAKFPNAAPDAKEASQSIIDASPQILKDLRAERDRLIDARSQEKQFLGSTKTGMGPAWNKLNDQVLEKDREITGQTRAEASARVALKDRDDYDIAKPRQEANAKATANGGATLNILYDNPIVIFMRVVGGAFVAIVSILVFFVSLKKLAEAKDAAEAKAEAAQRARKGWDTRRNRPRDAEFEESAPLDSRAIPDLGPVAPGALAEASTHTRQETDRDTHPDAAGDDYGARTNGHEDDNGTDETGSPPAK